MEVHINNIKTLLLQCANEAYAKSRFPDSRICHRAVQRIEELEKRVAELEKENAEMTDGQTLNVRG